VASQAQAAAQGRAGAGATATRPGVASAGWDGERRGEARVRTNVPVVCTLPQSRWSGTRRRAAPAVVRNASTAGLLIEAPTAPGLVPGDRFALACRGERGEVVLLRVDPSERERMSRYAVQLLHPSHELVEVLLAGTAYEPRTAIEESWDHIA